MTDFASTNANARCDMVLGELGRQFALISEEVACSSWAWRIEDELPPLLIEAASADRPTCYRGVEISPVYATWLVSLAGELGHWIMLGPDATYVPHMPAAGPLAIGPRPPSFPQGSPEPTT